MKKLRLMTLLAAVVFSAQALAANSPPEPSAPGIVTMQNHAASSQISPNDVDAGDTASYAISANPSHGSAQVSSSGLVTYTPANNYYGSDSLQVRVTDSANASGTVTIQIFVRGALIPTSLPEHVRFNASIVAACQTTLTLKYPATVDAYFMDEGAGYHNKISWYNTATPTSVHTIWNDASSVLDLLGNTDGTLHTGDRAEIGTFSSGETIGFQLYNVTGPHATFTSNAATNSDALNHVLIMAIPDTDFVMVSFEDKGGASDYDYNDVIMLLRVGRLNVQHWIDTSTQPLQYIPATKYTEEINKITEKDSDGDGVPDSQDMFPNDSTRAFMSYVPTPDYTIVAYEDLFPSIGDYDFNDAVVAYRLAYVTNSENKLVEIRGEAKLLAHGAALSHDWHLRLIGAGFSATATITQTPGAQSTNTLQTRSATSTTSVDASKTEIDLPVILDTGASLPWHFGNTVPGWSKGTGDTATFTVSFATPIDPLALDGAPFDPYLIVRDNGLDIHLPYKPLRKNSTNPKGTRSFINDEGMPWAIVIPATWQRPIEKTDIRTSYPRFTAWAASAGAQNTNWYLTPLQANVTQTPLSNDKFIWAGNVNPSKPSGRDAPGAVAPGFDFHTLASHRLSLFASERVVVSLLPVGGDPANAGHECVASFRMQGDTIQNVQVPAC